MTCGQIAKELRTALSPRHVPDQIYRYRGARAAVRQEARGAGQADSHRRAGGLRRRQGALANPESLTAFEELARERVEPRSRG